ncbi:MAG: hypothetical protein WKF48_03790 [Solirubrobacteraceae bacterium]
MFRGLVDELIRRRLLPVMLVAVLVIIAAPLLFLKSAPEGAPAASEAPPAAQTGDLPVGGESLVTSSDKATTPKYKGGSSQDPFAPPASAVNAAKAATASVTPAAPSGSPSAGKASSGGNVPSKAVITNADGSKAAITTKKPSTSTKSAPKSTPQVAPKATFASVSVRFAKRQGSKARRSIPRLQTFKADNTVAAMFVKYSPARKKAVFAIAPSTKVSGDVKCRRKKGVCRYVDIPEGEGVRLTVLKPNGAKISRRLDVVSIKTPSEIAASTIPVPATATRSTPLDEAKCLLRGLLLLPSIFPSIPADACA